MAVSFIGHTPNFAIWVFNIDGKRFVARNLSTPEPLNIKFAGAYDDSPLAAPLIKTSGFDITESSPRIVVWTWNGRLYTSSWDVNDEDIEDVVLYFSSPIPYSGPPVAPVGTGVTNTQSPPPPPVPTPVPSLPIDQNQNIMGGGQNQTRVVTPTKPIPSALLDTNPYANDMNWWMPLPAPAPTPTPSPAPAPTPSVSPAGTDWVKLGLQLGAAYLLLS